MLLEAISEDDYDKIIVDRCKNFVMDIKPNADKYIFTNRLALKAHLATVFSIVSPEKVFTTLDNVIREVPWEKSEVLRECFEKLREI